MAVFARRKFHPLIDCRWNSLFLCDFHAHSVPGTAAFFRTEEFCSEPDLMEPEIWISEPCPFKRTVFQEFSFSGPDQRIVEPFLERHAADPLDSLLGAIASCDDQINSKIFALNRNLEYSLISGCGFPHLKFKRFLLGFASFQDPFPACRSSVELERIRRIQIKIAERLVVQKKFDAAAFMKDFSDTGILFSDINFHNQFFSFAGNFRHASIFQFDFCRQRECRGIRNQHNAC